MSLGTPYYGAEMAGLFGGLFGAFCQNHQGEAMQVLDKEDARLLRDWQQKINKPEAEADRRTPKIPVHPFYGLRDELVEMASACGIDPGICDSVDGDHSSIAKPPGREHLTYRSLQSLKDKAGIKLSGDDLKVHVLFECDYKPFIKMIPPEGAPKVEMFFASSPSIRHTSYIQDLGIPGQANLLSDPEKNGGRGHVCQITNYEKYPVLNIELDFELRFKEPIYNPGQTVTGGAIKSAISWTSIVEKVEPNEKFVFYLINNSDCYLEADTPDWMYFRPLGEFQTRTVRLSTIRGRGTLHFDHRCIPYSPRC